MEDQLTVVSSLWQLLEENVSFRERFPPEVREEGRRELGLMLTRLATDVIAAEMRGTRLGDAGRDKDNYPHLFELHSAVRDFLTRELGPEEREYAQQGILFARQCIQSGEGNPIDSLFAQFGRLSVNPSTPPLDRALARVGLYQLVRLGLLIVQYEQKGGFASVDLNEEDLDSTAETSLQEWMEEAAANGDQSFRVLHFSLAACMMRLQEYVSHFQELRARMDQVEVERLRLREELSAQFQEMDRGDELLLRNRVAPLFGEQRLTVERLKEHHPHVFGDANRAALDKRLERLKKGLREKTPNRRKAPSLIDLTRALSVDEPMRLPEEET
jgi:hypothetical protein